MSKISKIVFVVIIAIFGLLLASNPNSLRGYTAWMFEGSEGEKVLPDLSNEEIEKMNAYEQSLQKSEEDVNIKEQSATGDLQPQMQEPAAVEPSLVKE